MRSGLILSLALLAGCAARPTPPPRAGEPIGLQMLRVEPALKKQKFNTLVSFEDPRDEVFVTPQPLAGAQIDRNRAHTGTASLQLPAGAEQLRVKLPSLLGGRAFPGEWTLAGAYLWATAPAQVEICYELEGKSLASRTIDLAPRQWTAALVDLAPLTDPNAPLAASVGNLVIRLGVNGGAAGAPIWCDDIVLLDNSESLVEEPQAMVAADPVWSIRRRGFQITGQCPGRFQFSLATPEASADGWNVEEANVLRARFSSIGREKALTIFVDGRAYWDGRFQPMSARNDVLQQAFAAQHEIPAEVSVAAGMGRVNRNTPGDANNDGYNEVRGAYQLVAQGGRLEFQLAPRTPALVRPVLEISGLPAGNVLVTVEGQLVDRSVRLDDQTLLLDLPVKLQRPTAVNVRVQ